MYARDVDKIELPGLLMELSKKYFRQLGREERPESITKKEVLQQKREVYQCSGCQTVYDPLVGDEKSGISPGVSFSELPDTYSCSVCEVPKSAFSKTSW